MGRTGPWDSHRPKGWNHLKFGNRRRSHNIGCLHQKNPETISIAVEQKIQHILRTLPAEIEAVFERLFELGIDLGIDKKGQLWILDINSKPGRKIIQALQPENMKDIHRAPLQYSQYLANHLQKAGE